MQACLKFVPGIVLSLENGKGFVPECPTAGLAEAIFFAYSPAANVTLRAFRVAPGDELLYLEELRRQPRVILTSLNYVGETEAHKRTPVFADIDAWKALWAVTFYEPGRVTRHNEGAALQDESGTVLPPPVRPPSGHDVAVILDTKHSHFRQVRDTLAWSHQPSGRPLCTLGLYLSEKGEGGGVDLLRYSLLLLGLCEVEFRVACVNFSVNLGVWCQGYSNLPAPLGDAAYSFPIFEKLLGAYLERARKGGNEPPLLVASAGNSAGKRVWRLSYPAVLPEMIAVTSALPSQYRGRDTLELVRHADLPAVRPLKPCFAEAGSAPDGEVGTSFASASFAGKCAAWDGKLDKAERDCAAGKFGKLGLLLSQAGERSWLLESPEAGITPVRMFLTSLRATLQSLAGFLRWPRNHNEINSGRGNTTGAWVSPRAEVFDLPAAPVRPSRKPNCFAEALRALNERSEGREFLLTGSGAFVAEWLRYNRLAERPIGGGGAGELHGLLGDLDFVYSGEPLPGDKVEAVFGPAKVAFEPFFEPGTSWRSCVRLLPLTTWGSAIHLLQCVIPAASLFLTPGGLISPWNVGDQIAKGLEVFLPNPGVWRLNPQFLDETLGVAHGLLICLNLHLIAARLRQAFPESLPTPLHDGVLGCLKQLQRAEPPSLRPYITVSVRARIERRDKRAKALRAGFTEKTRQQESELLHFADELLRCIKRLLPEEPDQGEPLLGTHEIPP